MQPTANVRAGRRAAAVQGPAVSGVPLPGELSGTMRTAAAEVAGTNEGAPAPSNQRDGGEQQDLFA